MELELGSLLNYEVDSVKEAGRLVINLPRLWNGSTIEEKLDYLCLVPEE